MLRRNVPVIKSVELVLRSEGILWLERFMKEICLEPGVKERVSYGWDVIKVFETETLPRYSYQNAL